VFWTQIQLWTQGHKHVHQSQCLHMNQPLPNNLMTLALHSMGCNLARLIFMLRLLLLSYPAEI
jgi:hypothetical protein